MKGVEIAKGFDVGVIRYGTSFVGQAQVNNETDTEPTTIGYWSIVLNYKGAENMRVCGGLNDVIWIRMEVYFTKGDLAGNKLVLGMTDNSGTPDVLWDFYDTPSTTIGGFDCNYPSAVELK